MPANPTPAEGVVVPLELLQRAHTFIEDCAFNGELQPTADSENPCELATDLAAYIAARPAAPTQSAAQTGEVERLRYALENTAARWLALDTDETEEAVRGYARKSVREIKAALSQREPGQ